ncbi:MAG: hypothetical protein A2314_02035 [Elusimicrobia bacterium RIFOXYB2_FULL_50_12]|nr:MAG: hypothetical protein A2314_02035 [Elusimicrobia bacterium RIFOXYB2_FULL_50_12]
MDKKMELKLIELRRDIHRHPELGNKEFRTTSVIEKFLSQAGIVTRRPSKTGVVALISGTKEGAGSSRVMALRADIDALPIAEKTNKPYSSRTTGVMHACGHDANTAMVAGAALLLARRRNEFAGTVKCIFQPNEEAAGGALGMIRAGVLKNPVPDCIVGIHVNPWLKTGTLGVKAGAMMAAVDRFTIKIAGARSHGAYPHLGKDSIVIAAQVIQSLQSVVARQIDPVDPAVVTVGTIQGGEAFNVLAGSVTITGTVRALNNKMRRDIERIMRRHVAMIVKAYGAGYSFEYESLGRPLENSAKVLSLCRRAGSAALGKKNIVEIEKPSMGGEDFSEYLRYVPGCFIFMGARLSVPHPWHSELFDVDERALAKGAAVLEEIAVSYLLGK